MPTAVKAINVLFLVSVLLLIVSRFESYRFPDLPDILPQTFQAPLQTETDHIPLNPEREDGKFLYEVEPLFDYELFGLVVSRHESKNDFGMFDHATAGDYLNTSDICVIWGDNLRNKIYQKMKFWNDDWSCQASFKPGTTQSDWAAFQMTDLSNNHLLSGNLGADETLAALRPGDQIHIKGKLVKYRKKGSAGPFRTSSTVRTDVGNGACEIIYVTSAKIVQPGDVLWRVLYAGSKFVAIALGLFLLVHYLRLKDIVLEMAGKSVSPAGS